MHPSRILRALVGPALFAALAGCGDSGPKVVQVNGTLNYKGKPVPSALLNFLPEHGRQSWAVTDEQGRFKVNYDEKQDGAVVGKHKIWIEHRPNTQAEQQAAMKGKPVRLSTELKAFFEKYSYSKSTLLREIDKNTKELNLDLE